MAVLLGRLHRGCVRGAQGYPNIFGTINKHERALDTRGESHEMRIGTRETGNNTLRAQTAADKTPIYKKEGKWEILTKRTFFKLAVSGSSQGCFRVVSR